MQVKHKRGIRIQTRIIISAIIVILQLAVMTVMLYTLSTHLLWLYTLIEFLSIILAISIINSKTNPSYKISWIVFILIVPIIGVSSYLLWGGGRILPHFRKKMIKSESHYLKYLENDDSVANRLKYEDLMHYRQADYLRREAVFPVYDGTTVEYLSPGEVFLPRLLDELESAKDYIFMEFFILAEGRMWQQVHEILKRKASEGVEVKIIFDDFGSIKRQHKDFVVNLRREGIEVSAFNRIRPSVDMFMNNRDHRKIVVIDGKTAMTGGLNIADEYVNYIERFGYWMDCAAIFKGDAVRSFLVMFMSMWTFTTGKVLNGDRYIKHYREAHDGFVLPYCDSPLNGRDPAQGAYMQILNTAQRYVYIVSPYLIIESEMITALSLAAKSGIDVRIITPKIWDKWYVHPVTQQNYEQLLEAGVRIYEYLPGFIHSKLFVSDDSVATVGTINMDYRSFFIHFECGAWICRSDAVLDIKDHISSIIEQSEEIQLKRWKKRPWWIKAKQQLLHILSPFM